MTELGGSVYREAGERPMPALKARFDDGYVCGRSLAAQACKLRPSGQKQFQCRDLNTR